MQKLIIKGNRELVGKISISGSKNATLPILAASILSNRVQLQNVPMVKDIFTMIELLSFIGLKSKFLKNKNILEIMKAVSNATQINEWSFDYYKGDSSKELNESNLSDSVLDNPEQYVLKYSQANETNEDLDRVRHLAGI